VLDPVGSIDVNFVVQIRVLSGQSEIMKAGSILGIDRSIDRIDHA
jgi:hypothetical protein